MKFLPLSSQYVYLVAYQNKTFFLLSCISPSSTFHSFIQNQYSCARLKDYIYFHLSFFFFLAFKKMSLDDQSDIIISLHNEKTSYIFAVPFPFSLFAILEYMQFWNRYSTKAKKAAIRAFKSTRSRCSVPSIILLGGLRLRVFCGRGVHLLPLNPHHILTS